MTTENVPGLWPDVDEALAALVRAGDSDLDKMAAYLAEQGDTGYARVPRNCPVSNYVARVTGLRVWVGVDIWHDSHGLGGSVPKSVGKLIYRIDSDAYPALIRSAEVS